MYTGIIGPCWSAYVVDAFPLHVVLKSSESVKSLISKSEAVYVVSVADISLLPSIDIFAPAVSASCFQLHVFLSPSLSVRSFISKSVAEYVWSVQGTFTTIWLLEFSWIQYVLPAVELTLFAATLCSVSLNSFTTHAVLDVASDAA